MGTDTLADAASALSFTLGNLGKTVTVWGGERGGWGFRGTGRVVAGWGSGKRGRRKRRRMGGGRVEMDGV